MAKALTNNKMQPYVLHTTDEGFSSNPSVPRHAIGFRTVDFSLATPYGGGKLGIYSSWNQTQGGATCPPPIGTGQTVPPTQPDLCVGPEQFEFYNYSPIITPPNPANPDGLTENYGELGNQIQLDATGQTPTGWPGTYWDNFNAIVEQELYSLEMPDGSGAPQYITSAQTAALAAYLAYANQTPSPTDTTWQT